MAESKAEGFSNFADPDRRQLRKDYIGLTPQDEETLKQLDSLIDKHLNELVKGFYRHLLQFDELRQFLSDELITTRLLSAQKEYLSSLVGGKYDEAYFQNRFHIGRVHERLKVTPSWYLGAYSRYLSMIFPLVFDAFSSSPGKILPAILALTRITFVDIDLTLDAYIQASSTKLAFANAELAKLTQELNRDLMQKTADLKNAQALFRAVFENAGVSLFTYERSGTLLLWNRAFEDLFGLDPEEIRGRTIEETVATGEEIQPTPGISEIVEKVFSGKGVMEILWKIRDRAGNSRHILGSTFPVKDAGGDIQFGVWLWFDITEKKQLREALARTEKLATMGILSSGLAHEIGTPMNVILGRAESLLRHTREEKTAEGLKIIIEQVERITRLMQHLLAFARRKPIEPRSADLRRILKRVIEMVSEEARKHHVRVVMEFDQETPLVKIDADQMEQVFINLTMNAIQAMPDGGELQIRIGRDRGKDQDATDPSASGVPEIIEIEFKDTGTGIEPEHLGKIFDPFFSTKPVGKGTGLGLAVTQSIIRDHGGEIQVESRVKQGTSFRILLPVR